MSTKQTSNQAYEEALGQSEQDDIFAALERAYRIKNKKPAPDDPLTLEKWKGWIGNASERERRAWMMDPYNFAVWLIEHKAEKKVGTDKKLTLTMPQGFEELSLVIVFIVGDDDRFDEDGILMSETNARVSNSPYPTLTLGSILSAFSMKEGPTFDEAVKGAWGAWKAHQEEYLAKNTGARNPFGASVEAWVTQPPKIESTSIYDAKRPAAIMRFPRGNFTVEMFSDNSPGGSLKRFADDSLVPQSAQLVLPIVPRKSVIRDPAKMLLTQVVGVPTTTRKGAVSPEVRVCVEALTQMPPKERVVQVHVVLGDLIDRLYPNGYHWTNQASTLIEAIMNIDNLRVPFRNLSGRIQKGWAPVKLNTMELSRRDDDVVFTVSLPEDANKGPMVEKKYVRLLGLISAPKWQAYFSLCDLFHRRGLVKGKNGFYIEDPTKPVERRNEERHLLNAQGQVIYGTNGEPLTDLYSQEAVKQLDREPNHKSIAEYPIVPFEDMLKACFPGRVYKSTSEKAIYLERAKQHFRELADLPSKAFGEKGEKKAPHIIKIIEYSNGWQFLPGESHVAVYRGVLTGGK